MNPTSIKHWERLAAASMSVHNIHSSEVQVHACILWLRLSKRGLHFTGGAAVNHAYGNGLDAEESGDVWSNYEPLALMLPTLFLAMEWIYEAPSICR